jgi:hypothetical protein
MVRWLDDISRNTIAELHRFAVSDRPSVIVTTDVNTNDWFMNWRIARYYFPHESIWVVDDHATQPVALRVMRDRVLESRAGAVTTVPIPRGGRILWLLENGGAFQAAAKAVQTLSGGPDVFYTDVSPDSQPFTIGKYMFVPQ